MMNSEFPDVQEIVRSVDRKSYLRQRIETGVSITDMLNSLTCALNYNGVIQALADYARIENADDKELIKLLDSAAVSVKLWEDVH